MARDLFLPLAPKAPKKICGGCIRGQSGPFFSSGEYILTQRSPGNTSKSQNWIIRVGFWAIHAIYTLTGAEDARNFVYGLVQRPPTMQSPPHSFVCGCCRQKERSRLCRPGWNQTCRLLRASSTQVPASRNGTLFGRQNVCYSGFLPPRDVPKPIRRQGRSFGHLGNRWRLQPFDWDLPFLT